MLAVQNSYKLINLFTYGLYTCIFHFSHQKMHHFQGYFSRTFQVLDFWRENPGLSPKRGNPVNKDTTTDEWRWLSLAHRLCWIMISFICLSSHFLATSLYLKHIASFKILVRSTVAKQRIFKRNVHVTVVLLIGETPWVVLCCKVLGGLSRTHWTCSMMASLASEY